MTSEVVAAVDAPARGRPSRESALAAGLSGLAGFLHVAAFPEHFLVSPLLGSALLVVGVGQLLLTLVLLEAPGTLTLLVAGSTHIVLVAVYVATRTVDVPLVPVHVAGHHVDADAVAAAAPGSTGNGVPVYAGSRVEPVGAADLLCVLAEVALVILLARASTGRQRRLLVDVALLAGASLLVLRLAAMA